MFAMSIYSSGAFVEELENATELSDAKYTTKISLSSQALQLQTVRSMGKVSIEPKQGGAGRRIGTE